MKKVVIKLPLIEDPKIRQKALKAVAGFLGVESVSIDVKERKITVIGEADPVTITMRLRKFGVTELESVGPAKDEKKNDKKEEKKDDKKKEDNNKKDEKKSQSPAPVSTSFATPVVCYDPYHNGSLYLAPVAPYRDDHSDSSDYCTIC